VPVLPASFRPPLRTPVVQGHGSGPAFLLGAAPLLAAVLTRLTIGRSAAVPTAGAGSPAV
jgi:hypothetical protein